MPATFAIDRWETHFDTNEAVDKIFIAGRITDPEFPGQSEYAEFWVNRNQLNEMPSDDEGRKNAILSWLQQRVDERHFLWAQQVASAPPPPEVYTGAEVAAAFGLGDTPELTLDQTFRDRGETPAPPPGVPGLGGVPNVNRPPRRASLFGTTTGGDVNAKEEMSTTSASAPASSATPEAHGSENAGGAKR